MLSIKLVIYISTVRMQLLDHSVYGRNDQKNWVEFLTLTNDLCGIFTKDTILNVSSLSLNGLSGEWDYTTLVNM